MEGNILLSSIYLIVLDFLIHCIFVNTFLADMKVFCTFVLKYLTNGNIRTELDFMKHIGKRIKEVMDEQGRSASWLAAKIPCERTNIYDVFKREDVSVQLLYKISSILGHDFFLELSVELHAEHGEPSPYDLPPISNK